MLRPVYNIGVFVYFETNLNEIVEKYCINKNKPQLQCNGQCHLAKQLQPDSSSEIAQVEYNLQSAFFPVYFQNVENFTFKVNLSDATTHLFGYHDTYQYLLYSAIEYPPTV